MIRRALLALGLGALLLCSCVSPGAVIRRLTGPDLERHGVAIIRYENISPAGLTYGYHDQPQVVLLDPSGTKTKQLFVLTHELLHVAGWIAHLQDDSCYFRAYASNELPEAPCEQEVALIRRIDRTFVLWPADGLIEMTEQAAAVWNEAAGRVVFTVLK